MGISGNVLGPHGVGKTSLAAAIAERLRVWYPWQRQYFLQGFSRKAFQADLRKMIEAEYSQTWELRPPKGLGVSGPIFQVVSFARFGSKNFHVELYTCPCASHDISDRWFPRVSGGVIGNDLAKRSLQTR